MSERRRLAERPRKVKYTRASPELAIFATRPRRVPGARRVQCTVSRVPSWCVLGRSRCLVCVFTVFCQCILPIGIASTDTAKAVESLYSIDPPFDDARAKEKERNSRFGTVTVASGDTLENL